jgi:hypothetical protein
MPNEHYMVEAKLILGVASEDIPNSVEIKTIVKDIWDIRMSKLRTSMDALMKSGGNYGRLDHLTMMEINSVKPLLPAAMDELYRIKMVSIFLLPYHSRFISEGVAETSRVPRIYQNCLAMRDTADVTSSKPIAICLQFISGVSAFNPLVLQHPWKKEIGAILLFCPRHHVRTNFFLLSNYY